MSNITMQDPTQIESGCAMPTGHAVDVLSGRVALSGTAAIVVATGVVTTGAVVRDRQGYTLGTADKAFPGSLAWRPPTT